MNGSNMLSNDNIRLRILLILICVLICVIVPSGIARADFESAVQHYRHRNYSEAFEEFTKLAEQGDARAQTVLALMHKFGEGTKKDSSRALELFHVAAQQGYAPAQFNIGSMYAEGIGVEVNMDVAMSWLRLAAEQGFSRAVEKLAEHYTGVNPTDSSVTVSSTSDWNFRLPNSVRQITPDPDPKLSGNGYQVQLGAMQTHTSATKLWKLLKQHHTDLLAFRDPIIHHDETRRIYRIKTGPFTNLADANRFCEEILSHSVQAGCLPIENE